MKNRFSWKLLAALLLMAALAASLLSGCGQGGSYATQKNFITVGVVCPLSGALASAGEGSLETEEEAIAEINESGGLYIDTLQRKLKVRFVIADSKSTEEGAKEAVNKLAEEANVDLMISSGGTRTAIAAAKACEELKLPFFSVGADPDLWRAAGPFTYSFNCASSDQEKIAALADLWKSMGITSVGLMATQSEEAEAFAAALSAFCSENGYSFTDSARIKPSPPDYVTSLNAMAGANVQALILFMEASEFSDAWQKSDIKGLSLSMLALAGDHLFTGEIAAIEKGTEIQEFYTTTDWDRKYPFESSLVETTGTDLSNWWENQFPSYASEQLAHKHASVEIALDAVKLAMALDAESICSAARSLNVDTILGLVDFDSDGISTIPCSVLHWNFDVPTVSWVKDLASHARLTDVEFDEE